ncbi:hypothetical protein ACFLT9_14050 [Acidobacteriota bacterium]
MKNNIRVGLIIAFVLTCIFTPSLQGVHTKQWDIYRYEDFLKGKFDGVSVSYDGLLSLAPQEKLIESPGEEFFLSLLFGRNEEIFLGTGHSGRIYKIDKAGKAELYFQVPEVDVLCLAQDRQGNLYAGTSPNGRIYKITEQAKGEPFFDPQERYIWDLLFIDDGMLLAAVGESGGIYQINSAGQGISILKAKENHILCLHRERNGDLLAGSGGKGHLYRIGENRKISVVFDSSYEEIRSVTTDPQGRIYVAAGGKVIKPGADALTTSGVQTATDVTITVTPQGTQSTPTTPVKANQPGALFRIDPSGVSSLLWSSPEDMVYSVVWDTPTRRILFGTGGKGRIFSLDVNDRISLLLQKDVEQAYHLASQNSRVYLLSNNPSGLSYIESGQRYTGEFTSHVLDSSMQSAWGRMNWDSSINADTSLQFLTRSGNTSQPDQTWSDWSPPYQNRKGEQILSPRARYLQFKIVFRTQAGKDSPGVNWVSLFYQELNHPPQLLRLEVLPPNAVFVKPPSTEDLIWGVDENVKHSDVDSSKPQSYMVPRQDVRKGYQTMMWQAVDRNLDKMTSSIQIKEINSSEWRILKDDLIENVFAFETVTLPDGTYQVKVETSDSPSNPQGTELKSEKISRSFVIDNSLPVIRGLSIQRNGNTLTLAFNAEDTFSYIKEVKVLVRPGGWNILLPEDGICDSKSEIFKVTYRLPAGSDDMITLRVVDAHGNVGVARQVF